MIAAAIEQSVTEQPDLDWKATGYSAPSNAWDELAKWRAQVSLAGTSIENLSQGWDRA